MTRYNERLGSSWIESATYDDETGDLTITTTKGKSYDHHNVPLAVWEGFIEAASPGTYWWDKLKDRYP